MLGESSKVLELVARWMKKLTFPDDQFRYAGEISALAWQVWWSSKAECCL
jgi:hypothetical protein